MGCSCCVWWYWQVRNGLLLTAFKNHRSSLEIDFFLLAQQGGFVIPKRVCGPSSGCCLLSCRICKVNNTYFLGVSFKTLRKHFRGFLSFQNYVEQKRGGNHIFSDVNEYNLFIKWVFVCQFILENIYNIAGSACWYLEGSTLKLQKWIQFRSSHQIVQYIRLWNTSYT